MHALLLKLLVAVSLLFQAAPSAAPVAPVATSEPAAVETVAAPAPVEEIAAAPAEREPRYGFVNTRRVTVRERPEAGSRVLGRYDASALPEYSFVSILATEGEYLNVSYEPGEGETGPRFSGWVKWGEVVPSSAAILVDAATGATKAVLPLDENTSGMRYSPDGSRALLLGSGAACCEASYGGTVLYEVSTSDLSVVRTVRLPCDAAWTEIGGAYYDARTGALHIALIEGEARQLSIATVDDAGAILEPKVIGTKLRSLAVSGDARVALAFVDTEVDVERSTFRVVDLETLEVGATVTIAEQNGYWSSDSALSHDGSELTGVVDNAIVAIDTRTGEVVSRATIPMSEESYLWMRGGFGSSGPQTVTATRYTEAGDPILEKSFWVGKGAPVAVDRRLAMTCEAAGSRFGVDTRGTKLFRLDEHGKVLSTTVLARPDLGGMLPAGERPILLGCSATPDARYVVLLVGIPSGC